MYPRLARSVPVVLVVVTIFFTRTVALRHERFDPFWMKPKWTFALLMNQLVSTHDCNTTIVFAALFKVGDMNFLMHMHLTSQDRLIAAVSAQHLPATAQLFQMNCHITYQHRLVALVTGSPSEWTAAEHMSLQVVCRE